MLKAPLEPHPLSNDVFPPPPPPEVPMVALDARDDDLPPLPSVVIHLERAPSQSPIRTVPGWVARLRSRVEQPDFYALLQAAKQLGGEWQPGYGFFFEHQEDGEAFLAATGN